MVKNCENCIWWTYREEYLVSGVQKKAGLCNKIQSHPYGSSTYGDFLCSHFEKSIPISEALEGLKSKLREKEGILKSIEENLFQVCTKEFGFPTMLHQNFCRMIVHVIRDSRRALQEVVKSAHFEQSCGTGYVEDRMVIPVHVFNVVKTAHDICVNSDPE